MSGVVSRADGGGTFEALRGQLHEAATAFADGPGALEGILRGARHLERTK